MNISVMIAATRARVALLVAGLAWFVGLEAPAGARIVTGALILIALAVDGAIDEGRVHATTSHDRTDSTRTEVHR